MKHKWEETDNCDTDGLVAETIRVEARDDCKGVPKQRRALAVKSLYGRKELLTVTGDHGGFLSGHCDVCGDSGWLSDIKHKRNCVLLDPGITHVRMTGVCARVVLDYSGTNGVLRWTSPAGIRYDIERHGRRPSTYYVMTERSTGKAVKDDAKLSDIRAWIKGHQGEL